LDDPAKVALAAFPARLEPVDLRSDNVTVTGAHNSFHMNLDFERIYGGGPGADLFIASKLYSQAISFVWEVYPGPKDLPLRKDQKVAPTDWQLRWAWLHQLFNQNAGTAGAEGQDGNPGRAALRAKLGEPATRRTGTELVSRVDIPTEPGDYLVRCVTASAPIGRNRLSRLSSE